MLWLQKVPRRRRGFVLAVLLLGGTILAGCADRETARLCDSDDGLLEAAGWSRDSVTLVELASANDALRMFTVQREDLWYDGRPVPRMLARTLPEDLGSLNSITKRKHAFVSIVLPLALRANEEIRADRRFVERALDCGKAGRPLSAADRERLRNLFRAYGANRDASKLLDRLDTVPPSLILAQAAIESGWGTSRFALQGNALFGQRTTNHARGIKAAAVTEGPPVYVASFPHLLASVRSYVHTLNTHGSYKTFRAIRSARRGIGRWPDGLGLAQTMTRYSERGPAYVRELDAIIRGNDFGTFDQARLEPVGTTVVVEGS